MIDGGETMRIGKFAENNLLSIDTIRHYMELGLIVPEKNGGQYFFDEKCQKALDEVIDLKDLGFSLGEIKDIFLYKIIGKLTPYKNNVYFNIFSNKLKSIDLEISKLTKTKHNLEEKMQELSKQGPKNTHRIGVHLNTLALFSCVKCYGELMLSDGSIVNNQIIDGKLSCRCGEEYHIKSGILFVENTNSENKFQQYFDSDFVREYINATDTEFLDNIYRGLQWLENKIDFSCFKKKVFLELGFGMGIFLRNIYDHLPEDCIYIAVDHDINRHNLVKNMLEMTNCKRNIVFVCSDFLQVPIKEKSIDILIDFSGTTNYSFHSTDFLLEFVDRYVKDHATLLGSYILFKNFSAKSLIEEKYRKNFIHKHIKDSILKLNYHIIDERVSDIIEKGGKYENFFKEGEKIYTYGIHAKR